MQMGARLAWRRAATVVRERAAWPEPAGFRDAARAPREARFNAALGEFILPYDAMRGLADPEGALMAFLSSTYAAAADLGHWDRAALECELGAPGRPRPV